MSVISRGNTKHCPWFTGVLCSLLVDGGSYPMEAEPRWVFSPFLFVLFDSQASFSAICCPCTSLLEFAVLDAKLRWQAEKSLVVLHTTIHYASCWSHQYRQAHRLGLVLQIHLAQGMNRMVSYRDDVGLPFTSARLLYFMDAKLKNCAV